MINLCKIDQRAISALVRMTIRTTWLHHQWSLPHLCKTTRSSVGQAANLASIPSNKKQYCDESQAAAATTPQWDSLPRKRSRVRKFSTSNINWICRALQRREHALLQTNIITSLVWQHLRQLEAALVTRRALRNAQMIWTLICKTYHLKVARLLYSIRLSRSHRCKTS